MPNSLYFYLTIQFTGLITAACFLQLHFSCWQWSILGLAAFVQVTCRVQSLHARCPRDNWNSKYLWICLLYASVLALSLTLDINQLSRQAQKATLLLLWLKTCATYWFFHFMHRFLMKYGRTQQATDPSHSCWHHSFSWPLEIQYIHHCEKV